MLTAMRSRFWMRVLRALLGAHDCGRTVGSGQASMVRQGMEKHPTRIACGSRTTSSSDMGKVMENPIALFEYKGVAFEYTATRHWVFKALPPGRASRWGCWSRFFTACERKLLDPDSSLELDDQKRIMFDGIDRALADEPVWRGDIRDQPNR